MYNDNKTVVITGGAKGLGNQVATCLRKEGHHVIVLDHNPVMEAGDTAENRKDNYYQVDVADWSAVNAVIDHIIERYRAVDVLINNVAMRMFKDFIEFDYDELRRYIALNLGVPILLTRRLLPIMQNKGYGRIINISSRSGFWGYQSGSMYCSTKSALILFTEGVAKELNVEKDNVTMNVICPDSFRNREGERLSHGDWVVETIARTISGLIDSKRNAEVIPIFRTRTKVIESLHCLRNHIIWLTR